MACKNSLDKKIENIEDPEIKKELEEAVDKADDKQVNLLNVIIDGVIGALSGILNNSDVKKNDVIKKIRKAVQEEE
jgi:hypothetical protein